MSGEYRGDTEWYCQGCDTMFSNEEPFHILYVADERENLCCTNYYNDHLENRI